MVIVPHNYYKDFFNIEANDCRSIVKYVEQHNLFFNNKTEFENKEEFEEFTLIFAQYIRCLEELGNYSKAITSSDMVLKLIESKSEVYSLNLSEHSNYIGILTCVGRSHYNMKDYDSSQMIFEKLVSFDQNNDYHNIWLKATKSAKRTAINIYLYIGAATLVLLTTILGDNFGTPAIRMSMNGIAMLFIIVGLANEYLVDKIKK